MTDLLRFSHLKRMAESPAHYRASVDGGFTANASMRLGTALHKRLAGESFPVYPGIRRGREWEAFKARHEGMEIMTEAEDAAGRAMTAAVRSSSLAMGLLTRAGARVEQSIYWRYNGQDARSTPDLYVPADVLVDVKTTRSSKPEWFDRDARRYHYPAQLAFYDDAIAAAFGEDARPREHYLIAIENKAPHCVTVVRVSHALLEQGRMLTRLWHERLRVCEASGEWPGYTQTIVDMDVMQDDTDLVFGDEEEEAAQ